MVDGAYGVCMRAFACVPTRYITMVARRRCADVYMRSNYDMAAEKKSGESAHARGGGEVWRVRHGLTLCAMRRVRARAEPSPCVPLRGAGVYLHSAHAVYARVVTSRVRPAQVWHRRGG
jgi:hypothetical protein